LCNERVEIEGNICGDSLRLKYKVSVRNEDKTDAESVLIAVPPSLRQNAHLSVAVYDDQNNPVKTNMTEIEPEFETPNDETLFRVALLKPLPERDSARIMVNLNLLNHVKANPSKARYRQKPSYVLSVPRYFYSPYATEAQVGSITFPSSEISLSAKSDALRTDGKRAKIDIRERVEPFQEEYIRVRFDHVDGMLKMESYEKEVLLSHWGAIVVKEDVTLRNVGPRVDDFSRLDYMYMENSGMHVNSLRSLEVNLPKDAYNVYYKDLIGNITTSRLRSPTRKGRHFEQIFRFPLVGGWKTYYWYGYTLPLSSALKQKGNKFVLKIGAQPGVAEPLPVDSATIKVVLPDGASNINVVPTDSSIEIASIETVYPTLAYLGRTMVVLKRKLFVADPATSIPIYISYNHAPYNVLRAPLVLFVGILTFLMMLTIFSQMDLELAKTRTEHDEELRLYKHVKALSEVDAKISALHAQFKEELRLYDRKDQTAEFKQSYAALLDRAKEYESEEAGIFTEIAKVSEEEGAKGPTLLAMLKSKREASQKLAAVATQLVEEKIRNEDAEKEADKLNAAIDSYSERIDIYMSNLMSHL